VFPDLKSFLPSVLRTFVPLLVGYFATFPILKTIGLDDDHVTTLATAVVTALYYLLVRVVETYVEPNAGWLLGWAGRPVYPLPADAGAAGGPVGDVAKVVRRSGTP
jgi:hypothetical protein